jgi:hypothetical protein
MISTPDRVDLGLGVREDERVLQLVEAEAEVLAHEVVHLQQQSKRVTKVPQFLK